MQEWGDPIGNGMHPWIDEALVVLAILAVLILHWLGRWVARRQRELACADYVDELLDEVLSSLEANGIVAATARWRPRSGRMMVDVQFADHRRLGVEGRIGTSTQDVVSALLMALQASEGFDATSEDVADAFEMPVPAEEHGWWNILGVARTASYSEVRTAYRTLAKTTHPDQGGSAEAMSALNAAMDTAKAEIAGGAA